MAYIQAGTMLLFLSCRVPFLLTESPKGEDRLVFAHYFQPTAVSFALFVWRLWAAVERTIGFWVKGESKNRPSLCSIIISSATCLVKKMDEISVLTKGHEGFNNETLLNGVSNCNLILFTSRFNKFVVLAFDKFPIIYYPWKLLSVESTCEYQIKQILSLLQQHLYNVYYNIKFICASLLKVSPQRAADLFRIVLLCFRANYWIKTCFSEKQVYKSSSL